jgi:hypothetical protein
MVQTTAEKVSKATVVMKEWRQTEIEETERSVQSLDMRPRAREVRGPRRAEP